MLGAQGTMDTTAHDLKLLSIGYYIQAGIIAFYSLLILGYAGFVGLLFTAAAKADEQRAQNGIPPAVASILLAVLGILLILLVGYTVCLFLAGYWIVRHRNRTFIYVIAALTCLGIPYGTVLGIFTFVAMQRPGAKHFFEPGSVAASVPEPPIMPESAAY